MPLRVDVGSALSGGSVDIAEASSRLRRSRSEVTLLRSTSHALKVLFRRGFFGCSANLWTTEFTVWGTPMITKLVGVAFGVVVLTGSAAHAIASYDFYDNL